MRVVDHFRHSMRRLPDGVHLTREGVTLARRVGLGLLDSYDRVVTSEIQRAIETAIAMGYGVDDQITLLGSMLFADEEVDWQKGCIGFAEAYQRGGQTRLAAEAHASLLRIQAALLPEDGRLLVISHGGIIELGVVGLLPDFDFASWGPSCGYCEGVRLYFEGTECTGAEILRVSDLTS